MKLLITCGVFIFTFFACTNDFDMTNPDVKEFVYQLKKGNFGYFEKNDRTGQLFLSMPIFTKKHIPELLHYASDTTHIENFPVSAATILNPCPPNRGFMLGECLLWTIESIRLSGATASLPVKGPMLYKKDRKWYAYSENYFWGLTGVEVQEAVRHYREWWNENCNGEWEKTDPLETSLYTWQDPYTSRAEY